MDYRVEEFEVKFEVFKKQLKKYLKHGIWEIREEFNSWYFHLAYLWGSLYVFRSFLLWMWMLTVFICSELLEENVRAGVFVKLERILREVTAQSQVYYYDGTSTE